MKPKPQQEEINKAVDEKICFIITPLGDDNSETRRKADGLIASVMKPVLKELGYKCIPPHEIDTSGSITIQIVKYILESPMVIANLSELNPNVMYELAIRHAKRLPVICLLENGTKLPFDLAAERTLFYENDMMGVEILKPRLKLAIQSAEKEENADNPIYRAINEMTILQEIKTDDGNNPINSFIINRLDDISRKLNSVTSYAERDLGYPLLARKFVNDSDAKIAPRLLIQAPGDNENFSIKYIRKLMGSITIAENIAYTIESLPTIPLAFLVTFAQNINIDIIDQLQNALIGFGLNVSKIHNIHPA